MRDDACLSLKADSLMPVTRTVTVADGSKTEKMHEIEQFRSLDAALTGSKGKKGQPVEEVDIVGADIAV